MIRFRLAPGDKPSSQCLGIRKHEDKTGALGRGRCLEPRPEVAAQPSTAFSSYTPAPGGLRVPSRL